MAQSTTILFKGAEQETHEAFKCYLRSRGMTFRGWLVTEERRLLAKVRGEKEAEEGTP